MKLVEPRFQPVSRVAVSTKLDSLYDQERKQLMDEITHQPSVSSVTVDFWTGCNGKSYMGSTVHYTFGNQLKSHVLFFVEVPPPHTSERVKEHFEDQLDLHNISCFKVITDNAANMKHAFELMTRQDSEDDVIPHDDESSNDLTTDFWQPKELNVEGWLGCSAHQLQLVLGDGFKEVRAYPRFQSILSKAKAISTLSHRSSSLSYKLSHRIPVPCDTRWNSHFKLYEHIVKHWENINESLQSIDRSDLKISSAQKDVLAVFVTVLDFFCEATDILQRESAATSNRVIPIVDSLENALMQTSGENAAINGFCERLLTSLRKRFQYVLTSDIYRAATALDPGTKLSFTDHENTERVGEGKFFLFSSIEVTQSIKSFLPVTEQQQTHHVPPVSHKSGSQPSNKRSRLMDFCSSGQVGDSAQLPKTVDTETELQAYLTQPLLSIDPIKFWSQRKSTALSSMALKLLSVPCSSAPAERLFSKAGIILNQRGSRTSSTKLEKLVFLHD